MARLRLILTLLPALAVPALGHLGDRVFPIYEIASSDLPDIHDESLEDWELAVPNASMNYTDFSISPGPTATFDQADLAFRVLLGWHYGSQRIYGAIERIDDSFVPAQPGSFLRDTSVFYVDGDHSGGRYASYNPCQEPEVYQQNFSQAQVFTLMPDPPDGVRFAQPGQAVSGSRRFEMGSFQIGQMPNRSLVEFWVTPWDDYDHEAPSYTTSRLSPGKVIGVLVTVWDIDDDVFRGDYRLVLPTVFENYSCDGSAYTDSEFADNFADAELVPCFHGDCTGSSSTAVVRDSWARIKASVAD